MCSLFLIKPLHVKFKVTNDLRTADILQNVQNQLSSQHGRVEDIHQQVGKITQLLKPLTTHVGSNGVIDPIPHKPIVFHGREDSVETVAGTLCNGTKPRVCILGSGGMEKTVLAAAVIESKDVQDKFKFRFWVPCIQATSTALFLELLYRYLRMIKRKCSRRRRLRAERIERPATHPGRQL